jgi:hypothetical protein
MERSGITNGISGTSPTKTNATKVARAVRIWPLDLQAELFREHGVYPEPAILRDYLNHTVERVAREALGGEDLAYLLAFALGDLLDLPLLAPPGFFDLLALAPPAGLRSRAQRSRARRSPLPQPRHYRECGDATVDAAQDRVAEVARSMAVLEPPPHRLRAVFSVQPVTSLVVHLNLARSRLLPASSERFKCNCLRPSVHNHCSIVWPTGVVPVEYSYNSTRRILRMNYFAVWPRGLATGR